MNIYRHIRDKQALEREYSPSTCVADLSALLQSYREQSEAVRTSLGTRQVHRYGAQPPEALDFFPPSPMQQHSFPVPALVYIHGGYWQELSKDEHSFPAAALNRQGIGYAAVNYGLAPQATLDEMVDRCRRAIAWISRHCDSLGIDPRAIHLAGCSAGAHLAAMTALAAWDSYGCRANPIRSLILLSGVFDLSPLPLTYVNRALAMSACDALRNSPMFLIDAAQVEFPPALIVFAEHETAEFKRQSTEFAHAILRRGGSAGLYEIPQKNHFDLIFDLGDESTRFGALTLEHLGKRRDEMQ